MWSMSETPNLGHRQRLRDRFKNDEEDSRSDEALLELLLTYAIPQKDVRPLTKQLLAEYGALVSILEAPLEDLCRIDGIKTNSAVLIKLVCWIRSNIGLSLPVKVESKKTLPLNLFTPLGEATQTHSSTERLIPKFNPKIIKRQGATLFGKALLAEAINILPHLPDSESLDEIRGFLRANLHFNAESTRQRNANYITRRMFSEGYADKPLRVFAAAFANTQELREVCFYRFLRAEPLAMEIIEDLLLPCIGSGSVLREKVRQHLKEKFPESRSIVDCGQAFVAALTAGGIAKTAVKNLSFAYRDIPLISFAFISHSEFPEPGMFDTEKLEHNRFIRAMLWNPDRLQTTLYELRNQGLISKISEIDSIRQFTTKYTLAEVVEQLVARRINSRAGELCPNGSVIT